jgi:hypothetical protein
MDTEKEYQFPQSTCAGHLQGVCITVSSQLEFIADWIEDDLYTQKELKDKILHQVKILKNAEKETNEILKKDYEKKINNL